MYRTETIQNTVAALEKIQQDGMTLAQATKVLHKDKKIPFDDIWPAIMRIQQLSEKEAMRTTKEWCEFYRN